MSLISFNEALMVQPVASPYANFPASSSVPLQHPAYRIVFPNHYLKIGRVLRLTMLGLASTFNSGSTIQFLLQMGATGTTTVFNMTGSTTNATVKSNVPFRLSGMFTIRAQGTGTGTTAYGIFQLQSEILTGGLLPTAVGQPQLLYPAAATAVSSGFDYAVANLMSVNLSSGTGGLQGGIQILQCVIESLN